MQVPVAFSAACVAACFTSWHNRWASAGGSRTAAAQPYVQTPPTIYPSAPQARQMPRQKPWERAEGRPGLATPKLASPLVPVQAAAPYLAHPLAVRQGMASAAASARTSVVAVMTSSRAWATGVVMSRDGLILTNAHLTHPGGRRAGGGSTSSSGGSWDLPDVHVLLAPSGADGGGGRREWARGRVLYVFEAFDLAVVQISDPPPPSLLPIHLQVFSMQPLIIDRASNAAYASLGFLCTLRNGFFVLWNDFFVL